MRVGSSSVKYFSTSFPAEASHASTDSGALASVSAPSSWAMANRSATPGSSRSSAQAGSSSSCAASTVRPRGRQVVEPLEHGVHQRAADGGEALALGQPVDRAEAVEQRAGLEVGGAARATARDGGARSRRRSRASRLGGPSGAGSVCSIAVMGPRLGRPTDSSERPRRIAYHGSHPAPSVRWPPVDTQQEHRRRRRTCGAAPSPSRCAGPAGAGAGSVRRRRPGAAHRPEGAAAHRRPRAGQAVPHPPRRDRARRPDRRARGLRRPFDGEHRLPGPAAAAGRLRAVHAARRAGHLPEGRRADRRLRRRRARHAGAGGRRGVRGADLLAAAGGRARRAR